MKPLSILFATACIVGATPLSAQQRPPDWAAFDRYVAQAARDWHVPGLAIAVVSHDSLVFAKGFGVAELGKPTLATEHTRFAIGSTTKAMTSAALAMLVDDGKLRWDDKVIDYLPDLRLYDAYATRELTVRDLLTHRTGLPGTDLLWALDENQYSMPEMIRRLRYVKPSSSFRSTWAYQNVVYAIGGLLVERISGMSWDAFIRTRIFTPLGMNESEPLVSGIRGKADVATPHAELSDTVRSVSMRSTDAIAPAGSVWSSVSDMSKWMRFMLDSGRVGTQHLITPATFRELVAPQMRAPMSEYPALELAQPHFFSYALGWFVQDYHGQTVWMHTGSIDGMSAIIGLMPEQHIGVYVLANLDHAELRHALMYQAFDLYGANPSSDWSGNLRALFDKRRAARGTPPVHVATTHPSLPLSQYVGTYMDSAYGAITVTTIDGALHARFEKADLGALEHWDYEIFRNRPRRPADGPTAITFLPNGNGGVDGLRAYGTTFSRVVQTRTSAALPAPASGGVALRADSAARDFNRMEVQIPMRDGVKLHTVVFIPRAQINALPIIFTRTPYGIANTARTLGGAYAELADESYIFAFQDIRGRFGSEGQFVMLRPMRDRKDPKGLDESTDAYDTIEWLLKNVPRNNGRVGMLGVSYPGWLTVMAMLDPHPALKAVSPQASPADMFIGDDFHHNGAFRLSYGFEYATRMETNKESSAFAFDRADLFDWYLSLGALAHANERYLHGTIPSWNNFSAHSSYDEFWQRQGVAQYLDRVRVPTLNVAGWWDQEDFYGPVKIYEMLERHDPNHLNYLVVGPWSHGGWGGASGQTLGDLDFGSPTSLDYRKNIQAPWFAHWLKDKGALTLAEATTFETGTNKWQSFSEWPARKMVTSRKLYTQADHRLSFAAPTESAAQSFDSYVSDPANPVPYRARPILPTYGAGSTWSRWLVDDQRFLEGRADVMTWKTEPLTGDVVIAGQLTAHLFASTTGSDADWVVKLIDVYPDENAANPKLGGYQLMVANDVTRARFRKGLSSPQPVTPYHVEEYVVDLHTQDYRFLEGHRIAVQVQSSWFPLIDRNPQRFVPNIFAARDSDFTVATQRIYRSGRSATFIELPVLERTPPLSRREAVGGR